MSPSPPSDEAASTPDRPAPDQAAAEFDALRDLLLGREKQQLDGLQERIENPVLHARDVSQVLPQAVALSAARGPQLGTALAPTVEAALKESVRRDPTPLVSAIFPIIGPAIRKSIAETFSKLVQSLNQTLDHSFSVRGLQWRIEAARTGRSFAEVVLARTLLFRVEQVLLIHRETGLLLLQIRAPHIKGEDAGMVSGMLTAIQDFARDSFHVPAGEALNTLQVGELNVWVETSPFLTLAAVIRGQAPEDFRDTLQRALENIHREQAAAIDAFQGDAAPFELARPHLESCLQAQFTEATKSSSSARLPLVLGVLVLLVAVWAFFSIRESRRWNGYIERLKAEPGIVVVETGKRAGQRFVTGLRDPLASDPDGFLSEFQLNAGKVASRWEPYQALSAPLVLKRAIALLQPPPGVTLHLRDGVLSAEGSAPAAWTETARQRAALLAGVDRFDTTALADATLAEITARQREIEQTVLLFEDGIRLAPGQDSILEALSAQVKDLRQSATRIGKRVRVSVIGHTDTTGPEQLNLRLNRQRADSVAGLLTARGVPGAVLTAQGADNTAPRSRQVTFRVILDDGPTTPPAP